MPLRITQRGLGDESLLVVEWGNGTRQAFAYAPNNVGFSVGQQLNGVVGGWALIEQGGTEYAHQRAADYTGPATMTVDAGATQLMSTTSWRFVHRQVP